MKLAAIIKNSSWKNVETIFLKNYPDSKEYIDVYQKLFLSLQKLEVEEDTIELAIQPASADEADDSAFIDVYGIDRKSKEEPPELVALEYVRWEKWLGMTIQQQTVITFTEPEIIAHCLYEMAWAGFVQKEIQEKRLEINKKIK